MSWATEVTVYKFQLLLGLEACLAGKGEPPLLSEDAGVVELLHMVDARYAPCHLLVAEPLQSLEVEVPKALVPSPGVIITVGYKAHGMHHLHMEDIKAIGASVHLSEKSVMAIPDAQYPMLDLDAWAILIQLSQADDRVPQRRDVLDTSE